MNRIALTIAALTLAAPAFAAAGHDSLRNTPTSKTGTAPLPRPGVYVNGNWISCGCGRSGNNPSLKFDQRWDSSTGYATQQLDYN